MNQAIVRFVLFLLAYTPLYIIGALKAMHGPFFNPWGIPISLGDVLRQNITSVAFAITALLLIVYFIIYSKLALNASGNPIFTIKSISTPHKEYITYLGTYILPFLGLKTATFFDTLAIVFMFFTIGFIYSKTKLIYTNPTLTFFGFEIYEVEAENGVKYDCISREKLTEGVKVVGKKLGEKTFIISKWKSQN